jgi:hypothetical protein
LAETVLGTEHPKSPANVPIQFKIAESQYSYMLRPSH